jgi:hypothetical protein
MRWLTNVSYQRISNVDIVALRAPLPKTSLLPKWPVGNGGDHLFRRALLFDDPRHRPLCSFRRSKKSKRRPFLGPVRIPAVKWVVLITYALDIELPRWLQHSTMGPLLPYVNILDINPI